MNLQHELQLKTANTPLTNIALLMGYSKKHADKASHRIQNVIDDPDLGLDAGLFDLKYSDEEFLKNLCEVLGLDTEMASREIKMISDDAFEIRTRYKPWIWVDTGFKRVNQPLFLYRCSFRSPKDFRYVSVWREFTQIQFQWLRESLKPLWYLR